MLTTGVPSSSTPVFTSSGHISACIVAASQRSAFSVSSSRYWVLHSDKVPVYRECLDSDEITGRNSRRRHSRAEPVTRRIESDPDDCLARCVADDNGGMGGTGLSLLLFSRGCPRSGSCISRRQSHPPGARAESFTRCLGSL